MLNCINFYTIHSSEGDVLDVLEFLINKENYLFYEILCHSILKDRVGVSVFGLDLFPSDVNLYLVTVNTFSFLNLLYKCLVQVTIKFIYVIQFGPIYSLYVSTKSSDI